MQVKMSSLRRRSWRIILAILAGAHVYVGSTIAHAEVTVEGDALAVRIEVREASVDEVLAALVRAFDLRIRSAATLDRRTSGTYRGSLDSVISQVLNGYDYVVKHAPGSMSVVVVGKSQNAGAGVVPVGTNGPRVVTGADDGGRVVTGANGEQVVTGADGARVVIRADGSRLAIGTDGGPGPSRGKRN
jgi:hypothetical protein